MNQSRTDTYADVYAGHYVEATNLLKRSRRRTSEREQAVVSVQAAQVHAMLALAAAADRIGDLLAERYG